MVFPTVPAAESPAFKSPAATSPAFSVVTLESPRRLARVPLVAGLLSVVLALGCTPGGNADAGPLELDAGSPEVEDGGQYDAGRPGDAGVSTDAGPPDPCLAANPDAALGTLELGAGWQEMNDVTPPESLFLSAIGIIDEGADVTRVYALTTTADVYDLGNFPALDATPTFVANAIHDDDDAGASFLSVGFHVDAEHAVIGYTGFDPATGGFPGRVAVIDLDTNSIRHINAPGNYSATITGDHVIINSLGAGALEGPGLYAVDLDTLTPSLVASFPDAEFAGSGFTTTVGDDIVAAGFANQAFDNILHAFDGRTLPAALSPVDTAAAPLVFSGPAHAVFSSREGAVLVRGGYDANFSPVFEGVDLVHVTRDSDGAPQVGTTERVLSFSDACTRVTSVAPSSSEALFALIEIDGGARIVHLDRE